MGFDIYITCSLGICKDTGRHFYYRGVDKVYGVPPDVPEEHREFVRMKGKIFRNYAGFLRHMISTSIENFIYQWPEWSDIVEDADYKEYAEIWNEDTHKRFYNALKWFSEQNGCYMISGY